MGPQTCSPASRSGRGLEYVKQCRCQPFKLFTCLASRQGYDDLWISRNVHPTRIILPKNLWTGGSA
jgi:hypothetical protein